MLSLDKKNMIINFLNTKIPKLEWIGLFGSVTNDTFNINKSDIDIAFITSSEITNVQRWEIQEKLASQLNIDIDLIDLKKSNTVLSYEVLTRGDRIFEKTSKKLTSFLDAIYINYLQLNEDRKEIIEMYT